MAERRQEIPLEPVDSLTVTTLVDNVFDVFMPDQGPAHRVSPATAGGTLPTATMIAGVVPDQLIAEHGLSLLLTVTKGQNSHQLLFDTGVSPDGMVGNMDRLQLDTRDIEAIVCSHGHFDHTAGLDGLIRRVAQVRLPVLIHPDFWNRRRVRIPGRDPLEIPTTSRSAGRGAAGHRGTGGTQGREGQTAHRPHQLPDLRSPRAARTASLQRDLGRRRGPLP